MLRFLKIVIVIESPEELPLAKKFRKGSAP